MKDLYLVFGIIAPLSYTLAVIIGGCLIQGYSHIYNSISELTATNVPKKPVIFILLAIYNISLILFGVGFYGNTESTSPGLVKIASLLIILVGILGIAMLYYVQEPRNVKMTHVGKMHLILASISSLLTMVIIVMVGLSFRNNPALKSLSLYSYISFGFLFITGGIAGASVAKDAPFGGLFERLTIGAFMQWIFVIALNLF